MKNSLNIKVASLLAAVFTLAFVLLPSAAYAANGRYVKNMKFGGSTNDKTEVTQLQKFFLKRGWIKDSYVTGTFGAITKEQVLRFQKERGIPETGEVDKLTRAWLDECEF